MSKDLIFTRETDLSVVASRTFSLIILCLLNQRSPTFLAPGTGFVEDNFSTDGGWGGDCSHGNASDGEGWGTADEAFLACLPLTSCCVCSPVPNRLRTGTSPRPGGWGPLF